VQASVLKGDTVRLNEIPLTLIVPGLGLHARGTQIMLDILSLDVVTLGISVRIAQVLGAGQTALADDDDEGEGGEGDGGEGWSGEEGGGNTEGGDGSEGNDGTGSGDGDSRHAAAASDAPDATDASPLAASLMAAQSRDTSTNAAC
jgi:exoribonuclease-2